MLMDLIWSFNGSLLLKDQSLDHFESVNLTSTRIKVWYDLRKSREDRDVGAENTYVVLVP